MLTCEVVDQINQCTVQWNVSTVILPYHASPDTAMYRTRWIYSKCELVFKPAKCLVSWNCLYPGNWCAQACVCVCACVCMCVFMHVCLCAHVCVHSKATDHDVTYTCNNHLYSKKILYMTFGLSSTTCCGTLRRQSWFHVSHERWYLAIQCW